jgi:hypothetical protein
LFARTLVSCGYFSAIHDVASGRRLETREYSK